MPPLIVAVVAAVAAVAVTTSAAVIALIGATGAIIAGAVAGAVVSFGLSMLFGIGQQKKNSLATTADTQQLVRAPVEARRVIYGEARVSGVLVYAGSSGADLGTLHLVIVLAGHRCAGIDTIWLDSNAITPDQIDGGGNVVAGDYAGLVRIHKYLGTQTAADASLISESPDGWGASDKLLGCAYLYIRLEYDRNKFSSIPNITAMVRGKDDVVDIRTGTAGYTANWALCVLDFLRADFGMQCSADEIDTGTFVAAANLADEAVWISAGGATTQPRYVLQGTFTLDQKPIDIMDHMMAAGAGTLVYVQGTYRLYGGAYEAPSASLGLSDFAGPLQVQTRPAAADLFNSISGTFIDPGQYWQAAEFDAVQDSAAVSADGIELWKNVDFVFVADRTQAARLATQMLKRARSPLIVKAPLRYSGLPLCAWQVVALTVADFGWDAKPFRVTTWEFDPASGVPTVTLQEEEPSAYTWTYDLTPATPDTPTTTLINPLALPTPTGLTLTATTTVQNDGTVIAALEADWSAVSHAFVTAYEVQWRLSAGPGPWATTQVPAPTARALLAPVVVGAGYDVQVRAVAGLVRGGWSATGSTTMAPDTTPPGAPTSPSVTPTPKGFGLRWTNDAAPDLRYVAVYERTATGAAWVKIAEPTTDYIVLAGYAVGDYRQFGLQSVDNSGNASCIVLAGDGTVPAVGTADIGGGSVTGAVHVAVTPAVSVAAPGSGYALALVASLDITLEGDGRAFVFSRFPHVVPTFSDGGSTAGGGG